MKRLLLLALAILAATQASGQSSASACWLGATWTTCFKPVIHTSMEGPASPTVSGYLASADWRTFNAAVAPTRTINTTAPLAGGGALSSDLTLSIPAATATVSGYLASGDWRTFNGKGGAYTQGNLTEATSSVLTFSGGTGAVFGSGTTVQVTQSGAAANGYLGSTDWQQFNARVATTRSISTTAPITGGGALSGNLTLAIAKANGSTDGYLSSADWTAFNNQTVNGSSTYSPTLTNVSNTSGLSTNTTYYFRAGGMVYVFGTCNINTGAASASATLTLPITPATFSAASQAGGAGVAPNGHSWQITATNSATTVTFTQTADGGSGTVSFIFGYRL